MARLPERNDNDRAMVTADKVKICKDGLDWLPLQGSPWDERAADHARDAASDFNHRLAAPGYDAGGS
jgi:hypothetical protein